MKSILKAPNEVLTTKTQPVAQVDKKVLEFIKQMKETLSNAHNPKGVGLAATQIGSNKCIFIMAPRTTSAITVCVNPEVLEKSETLIDVTPDKNSRLEGCLSIPQVWGMVKRHKWVTIRYLDESGKTVEQKFTGFPAIIVQHEMDHLKGVLFTQRVLEQKGKLYKPAINDKGEEVLEEMEI